MVSEADVAGGRSELRTRRLEKLQALHARGVQAYPYRYPTDATVEGVRAASAGLAPDVRTTERARIAGRRR
jgi:lysyl-tRNA synthetase class 2